MTRFTLLRKSATGRFDISVGHRATEAEAQELAESVKDQGWELRLIERERAYPFKAVRTIQLGR